MRERQRDENPVPRVKTTMEVMASGTVGENARSANPIMRKARETRARMRSLLRVGSPHWKGLRTCERREVAVLDLGVEVRKWDRSGRMARRRNMFTPARRDWRKFASEIVQEYRLLTYLTQREMAWIWRGWIRKVKMRRRIAGEWRIEVAAWKLAYRLLAMWHSRPTRVEGA
jgi:hypothetical protein